MSFVSFLRFFSRVVAVSVIALVAAPAFAQVAGFSFALVAPVQNATVGTPVVFAGFFNNATADNIYLNGLEFSAAAGSPNVSFANNPNFDIDVTPFFDNQAANLNFNATTMTFFLEPGQSATFDIFRVTALAGTPAPATYDATVTVTGGAPTGDAELAEALAALNLQPVPAPPAWMSLPVGAGIAALMGVVKRRRRPATPGASRSAAG